MKQDLLEVAKIVGEKISSEYITRGSYYPQKPWGCEGLIYPSLTGIGLLNLYSKTGSEVFLEGVKSIIKSNISNQMKSGGWPLSLGLTANGMKFHVSKEIIKITSEIEDLPPTVTALRLISEYQNFTGDHSFKSSLEKGISFLMSHWNNQENIFNEILTGEALKLRASPKDYHIYAFQFMESLQKIYPDMKKYRRGLYSAVKKNFESMTKDTYPLLYAMHSAIICQTEGKSEYVCDVVKKRIVDEIAFNSRFLIKARPGATGHRDGVRGVCLDEGHLRNSVGVALALNFYDKFTSSTEFTESNLNNDLQSWIQSMFDDHRYYEFQDIKTGKKYGDGSPAYFLPLFWILESF